MTRRIKYPPRLREPRSPTPHPCVILALDPGATTGWCILDRGMPQGHGFCAAEDQLTLCSIAAEAVAYAATEALPLVCVAERWSAGGWMSHQTLLGLGAAWGQCKTALQESRIPKRKTIRVLPQVWQSVVFGGRPADTKREAAIVASAAVGTEVSGDAADAVCIGLWAACSPDVWHALKKKERDNKVYEAALADVAARRAQWLLERMTK